MKQSIARLVLLAVVGVSGCSGTCGGSHNYATVDGGVVTYEDCSNFGGSHGALYTGGKLASLTLDSNEESIEEAVNIIYDLTPYAIVFFRADHLDNGGSLDMGNLSGLAIHDRTASGQLPTEAELTKGTLEVLKGPRGDDDTPRYKLKWDLTFGTDFQVHKGEKWIQFSGTSSNLLPSDFSLPPDYDDDDKPVDPNANCDYEGDLTLASNTDLSNALPLCSVSGTLTLMGTLDSAAELSSLKTVGGLTISQSQLSSLDGLAGLENIIGTLSITNNTALVQADSLSAVVGDVVVVSGNLQLRAIGFSPAQSEIGLLSVTSNLALTSLSGLSGLTEAEEIEVSGNPALLALQIPALARVNDRLLIQDNGALASLDFGGLTDVGILHLRGNSIANVAGFSGLTQASSLLIEVESQLTDLSGFDGLQTVDSALELRSLAALTLLDDFPSLTRVSSVVVQQNDALVTMAGFGNVSSLSTLMISNNDALSTASGFASLLALDTLDLMGNTSLIQIGLLDGLGAVGVLEIEGSDALERVFPVSAASTVIGELYLLRNVGLLTLGTATLTSVLDVEDSPLLSTLGVDVAGQPLDAVRLVGVGVQSLSDLGAAGTIDTLTLEQLALSDLAGLGAVPVAALSLIDMGALVSLDGFAPAAVMTSVVALRTGLVEVDALSGVQRASIHLESNGQLTSILGLGGLQQSDSMLVLDSPALVSAPDFTMLTRVDQLWLDGTGLSRTPSCPALTDSAIGLFFTNNDALVEIGGLDSLQTVPTLSIEGNALLSQLTALPGLSTVSVSAAISNNPALCQSAAVRVMDQFAAPSETASGNLGGC